MISICGECAYSTVDNVKLPMTTYTRDESITEAMERAVIRVLGWTVRFHGGGCVGRSKGFRFEGLPGWKRLLVELSLLTIGAS